MTTRPVQLSIVDGLERPVGPILPSVFTGTNADLMAAVAPLYLTGSVLDVTYGNGDTAGGWWRRFTPEPFTFHDLALDGIDFRCLPYDHGEFDTVCFDPPYVLSGGPSSAALGARFHDQYGIGDTNFGVSVGANGRRILRDLITDGLREVCRVAAGFVLVKCMEFAQGGEFHDIPMLVTAHAADLGWTKHDQIVHHTGPGPGGHNITTVKRARRVHSYLLVFAKAQP